VECPTGCGCRCLEKQFTSKDDDVEGGWKDGRPVLVGEVALVEEEKEVVEKMPSLREMRDGGKKGIW